jgi:hypothetical protein
MTQRHSIAVFPLNTVLFPGGMLPLKIFEQRYLDMTKVCLRDGSPFGVCRITAGSEVGEAAVPETTGCTATILDWEMPHLGVFHLRTRGQQPFRIIEHRVQKDGLIRAEVEWLEDHPGHPDGETLTLCRRVLEQVISRIGSDYFFPPLAYDDPRWTSYRLAEVLPLELPEKQALLEMREDAARLSRLHAYLKRVG